MGGCCRNGFFGQIERNEGSDGVEGVAVDKVLAVKGAGEFFFDEGGPIAVAVMPPGCDFTQELLFGSYPAVVVNERKTICGEGMPEFFSLRMVKDASSFAGVHEVSES